MHVTRLDEAPEYYAPGHEGTRCLRMLGMGVSPAGFGWMGLSIIQPGGAIEKSASPYEKFYLVLEGELVFVSGETTMTLQRWDVCRFAPNQDREVRNLMDRPATVVLIMSNVILE